MSSARCEPSKLPDIYVDPEDDDSYETRDYFRRNFRSVAVRRPRKKTAGQATPKRSESLKVGKTETASMNNEKIGKYLRTNL